jgi:hypothetical protein
MTEPNTPSEPALITPDLIKWTLDQIVDRGLHPIRSSAWAGQEKLIAEIARCHSLRPEHARCVLNAAVEHLFREQADSSPDAERRLMILRLEKLARKLNKELSQPKRTKTYTYTVKRDESGEKLKDSQGKTRYSKELKSETVVFSMDTTKIVQLIAVETLRIKLLSLDKTTTSEDLIKRMVGELDRMFEKKGDIEGKVSVHEITRGIDFSSFPSRSRAIVNQAIEAENPADSTGGASAPSDGSTEKP